MRYFIELAYNGTRFCGWQRQPNGVTVQEVLEKALSTLLRKETEIIGCGRTDTGVHATQYFAHFDTETIVPKDTAHHINRILSKDVSVKHIFLVEDTVHARFGATKRSYEYTILFHKNPFLTETAYYLHVAKQLDVVKMNEAAALLLSYQDFTTFCKTGGDTPTHICHLTRSEWVLDEKNDQLVFHISANRFLRGMVRLIVGACLNVGLGKTDISILKKAMDTQSVLPKSLSVPPHGLSLTKIEYEVLSEKF
jgi:tRNA pseudouridine38-40 synthase